jgi:hypothetical protein
LCTARRKVFFFEKKKQKTFGRLSRTLPAAHAKVKKVFWFFFSKKNRFLPASAFSLYLKRVLTVGFPGFTLFDNET